MKDQTRFGELNDIIDAAKKGYDLYEGVFKNMMDMYLLKLDEKTEASLIRRRKSHIYFPAINSKVKRIVNSFQESYFSSDEFAKLKPTDDENAKKAEALQAATDHYLNYRLNLFNVLTDAFYNIPVLGTGVLKSYWSEGRVKIEHVSLQDIFFDPSAATWEDVRYIVNNIYPTGGDIKRLQRTGVFRRDFKVEDLQQSDDHDNTDHYSRIKLQEVYTQNAKGLWTVSTIYDQNIVLRQDVVLQDGHPFSRGILMPQLVDIDETTAVLCYGEPAISSSEALQIETNIRRNQQIDAIKTLLNPRVAYGENSGVNPLDLEKQTGGIKVRNAADIAPLPAPKLEGSIFDVDKLNRDIDENMGVSPQSNGAGDSKDMTATESSIISNEGNMRLQSYIRSLNETLIEPLFERVAKLVWKYGEARFFVGLDRSEEFEFIAKVNTGLGATNKEIQVHGLKDAFMMTDKLLQMAMSVQDQTTTQQSISAAKKLVRELLPLLGIADVDNYFPEDNQNGFKINEPTNGQQPVAGQPAGSLGAGGDQAQGGAPVPQAINGMGGHAQLPTA